MTQRRIENITPFRDIDLSRKNIAELVERRVKMKDRLKRWRDREREAEATGQEPVLAEARKRCRRLLELIRKNTVAMGVLG